MIQEVGHEARREPATARGTGLVALVTGDEVTHRRASGALARAGLQVAIVTASAAQLSAAHDVGEVRVAVFACDPADLERPANLELLRMLLPHAFVIVVCPGESRRAVRTALAAGADAYVDEGAIDWALAPVVHAVQAGQVCVPRAVRDVLGRPSLSHRERQVLRLIAAGLTNAQIASRLYLAESTVKSHVSACFRKLGVRSRREAAAIARDPESGLGLDVGA